MKFKTLDNREIRLEIRPSKYPRRARSDCKSEGQYHLGCRIAELYPGVVILEEFTLPGSRLQLDFFLPTQDLAFEFQGEQHDKYNAFFHGNKTGFERSKRRDQDKARWCKMNKIALIYVYTLLASKEELKGLIHHE